MTILLYFISVTDFYLFLAVLQTFPKPSCCAVFRALFRWKYLFERYTIIDLSFNSCGVGIVCKGKFAGIMWEMLYVYIRWLASLIFFLEIFRHNVLERHFVVALQI